MDRALLNKATSSDETPTPGYMYGEIVQITHAGPQACEQLEDYLLKKLPKDSAQVKLKCLRIIKNVCDKGRPDFKRNIQKKADIVKACLSYRGQPHPLKGDEPSKAVREEAEATLKVIFSSTQQNAYGQIRSDQGANYDANKFKSVSSTAYASSNYNQSGYQVEEDYSRGNRMSGYGNPAFNNRPREEPTMFQKATDTAWAIASKVSEKLPAALNRGRPSGGPSSMNGSVPPFGDSAMPGGPVWRPPTLPHNDHSASYANVQNRWGAGSGHERQPEREPAGEYESRLVDELCAPGGARVALSQPILDEFCQKCESLDSDAVADHLLRNLAEGEWQTKLKALCAVEALVDANLDGITGAIYERGEDILPACKEVPQCHMRAEKVLNLLGFGPEPRPPRVIVAPVAPVTDLLDLGGEAQSDLVGFASSASKADVEDELFSGLDMQTQSPVPRSTGSSLLDDVLGASDGNDLFADLQVSAPAQAFVPVRDTPVTSPAVPQRQPTQKTRGSHLDVLSLSRQNSSSSGIGSLGMALQDGGSIRPIQLTQTPSPSASAFNFISGARSVPEESPTDNFNFVRTHMKG